MKSSDGGAVAAVAVVLNFNYICVSRYGRQSNGLAQRMRVCLRIWVRFQHRIVTWRVAFRQTRELFFLANSVSSFCFVDKELTQRPTTSRRFCPVPINNKHQIDIWPSHTEHRRMMRRFSHRRFWFRFFFLLFQLRDRTFLETFQLHTCTWIITAAAAAAATATAAAEKIFCDWNSYLMHTYNVYHHRRRACIRTIKMNK